MTKQELYSAPAELEVLEALGLPPSTSLARAVEYMLREIERLKRPAPLDPTDPAEADAATKELYKKLGVDDEAWRRHEAKEVRRDRIIWPCLTTSAVADPEELKWLIAECGILPRTPESEPGGPIQ
jgi:hypothetical protein